MIKLLDQYGKPIQAVSRQRYNRYSANEYSTTRRQVSSFTGANSGRISAGDRKKLVDASRLLTANVGFIKGALLDFAGYTVGNAWNLSLGDSKEANLYEDYFRDWSRNADIRGRLDFRTILKTISFLMDRDGDVGIQFIRDTAGNPKIGLIESHHICSKWDDKDYYDGVKLNAYGKPTHYSINNGEKVYTARVMQLAYENIGYDEVRGITSLAHAINDMLDRDEILTAELLAVKLNSKIPMVITSASLAQDPEAAFFGSNTEDAGSNLTYQQITDGSIPKLLPGETLESFNNVRPNSAFSGFLQEIVRNTALGLGLPFEFVYDASSLNGTGNRIALEKVDRRIQERQQTLLRVAERIYAFVVGSAFLKGDIPAMKDWDRPVFQMPKKLSIDPGRDGRQALDEIRMGVKSGTSFCSERGINYEIIQNQKKAETINLFKAAQDIAKEVGVPFEVALNELKQTTPNGPVLNPIYNNNPLTGEPYITDENDSDTND